MITSEYKLRRYCTNFKEIENYEEALRSSELYDLHHRKEIETFEDGTTVIRSRKELKDLGLYYHRPAEEMIFLKHSEHMSLHNRLENSLVSNKGDNNPMYGRTGDKNPMYGKKRSVETRAKISAAMKGKRVGDKNHNWKGDLALPLSKYIRERRRKRREALASSLT